MFNTKHPRKPNRFHSLVRTLSFISFSLLLIRLGYLGKIGAELMGFFFVIMVIILALRKQVLYAILGIISFVLFIKLYTNGTHEEWSVIISVIALGLVLAVIYKMVKTLFSK